jgi:hypothetical protein
MRSIAFCRFRFALGGQRLLPAGEAFDQPNFRHPARNPPPALRDNDPLFRNILAASRLWKSSEFVGVGVKSACHRPDGPASGSAPAGQQKWRQNFIEPW